MTVVRDDADGLVAWLAAGTEVLKQHLRVDGRHVRAVKAEMFSVERMPSRTVWRNNDVLRVAPTGAPWSVWLLWDADTREFRGWYGNIEAPHRREGDKVLTRDYTLDVEITPDRRRRRKDEDELEIALQAGWYTEDEVAWILDAAAELEATIDAWASPFCDGWERFTPDPSWPIPALPAELGPSVASG